jgi:hypothetical protein
MKATALESILATNVTLDFPCERRRVSINDTRCIAIYARRQSFRQWCRIHRIDRNWHLLSHIFRNYSAKTRFNHRLSSTHDH